MYRDLVPGLSWMWLAILLSFGFYLPVVLWSNMNPKIGMLMYVILNISILFLLLRGKLKGLERFRLIFVGTSLLQIYCYIASLFYINNSIQSYGEIYKRIKTFPSPFDYVDVTAYIFVFIQLIILIIMYFDTIVDILKLRNHKVISKLIVKISQH